MKKVRFFSVAVAVVMALFVCVWAGTVTYGITTQNGIISAGKKDALTSAQCFKMPGPDTSYMKKVTLKGTLGINTYCLPVTQNRYVILTDVNLNEINKAQVAINTSFSGVVINFPAKTYKANGSYCIRGYVEMLNAATSNPICGISLTSGSGTWEW
jgi:hypothetical protein